jgi:hypothetical protein
MKQRSFALVLAASLLTPLVLMAIGSARPVQASLFAEPWLLWMNWLYMAAPLLVFLVIRMTVAPALSRIAIPTMLALNALLICFQSWIWLSVSWREGPLAWVLYIPLWIFLVIAACICSAVAARRAPGL